MSRTLVYFVILVTWLVKLDCEVYQDRPKLKTSNGDLILEPAFGKNIYLLPNGPQSKVFVGEVNILSASSTPDNGQPSTNADVEALLNGPNGILQRLANLERRRWPSPVNIPSNTTILWRRFNFLQRRMFTLQTQINNIEKDDCQSNPCLHGGTCLNLPTGFYCLCPSNWEGQACDIDVNECRNFAGTELGCQNGATCINKPGYYECMCRPGWYGLHCTRRARECSGDNFEMCGHGTCITLTSGTGITCMCHPGWTTNGTGVECLTDINECDLYQTPHCSMNPRVQCLNLPGSFRCGPCPPGYVGNGFACADIDECTTTPNGGCSPLVACHNTVGSRICGPCPPGYQGDGIVCEWRGSCNINHGGCHPSAQCIENLAPGRGQTATCICPDGMDGDGVGPHGCYVTTGANVTDRCANNPCGSHGRCHVLRSGYTCICQRGFGGAHCDSLSNACAVNPCFNNGICRPDDSSNSGFRCECTAEYSGPLCQTRGRTCGSVLDAEEGSIVYPLSNTTYNHNSRCAWVIHTAPDKVINVTFSKFSLEDHSECHFDFLQIHDGRSAASQLIGRFCGNNFPNGGNIVSSHNNLYLWFRSDGTIAKNGFALHWTSINPVCGGEIQATAHGQISSPGSPGKYPPNRDCYWHLTANLGKRIQLHFFGLDIEKHQNCSFDYLAIYDGMRKTDPLLNKYCNSTQPAPLTSGSSEILIHFHSDASGTGNGFQISYAPIEGLPGCGGYFTAARGELTSPSYNGSYIHELVCEYKIQTAVGTRVKLEFNQFKLEPSVRCNFDYLKIYDGPSAESPFVGKFCGQTHPKTYVASSNSIFLIFKSDNSISSEGFKIFYEALCQFTLVGDSGILKSPGYPFSYPENRVCEYIINTTPGKAIVLTFQDFDIEENDYFDCQYDNVEIKDGPDANSTLLGRYCGGADKMPPVLTSSQNYMYVRFQSDMSISGTGFYANYTTVNVACGGIYRENTGLINFPSSESTTYENDQDCTWILVAPEGRHIKLTWNRFEIERMPSCESDYLELIEIDDNNNQNSLGKYCGNKSPPALTVTSPRLMLKFQSDSSVKSTGFSVSYTFLDEVSHCGGHYHRSSGVIYSPGWPDRYQPDRDCRWTISVPYGQQIRLNISQFDLERPIRGKCDHGDYLEIRNGASETSPLFGKFCGKFQYKRITSWSSSLYLHFHSDIYITGNGFKIEWDSSITGCGGTMTASSGYITSPNYPEPYNENANCYYRISTTVGSRIRITFTDLELERTPNCRDDYIEIFDGRDSDSNSLGKHCSMTTGLSIDTSSNYAFIKFRSDFYIGGKGFLLNYNTICNNNLTGLYGAIESPDYPNNYPTQLNCLWTIDVPTGNKINVTFTHFDIYKYNRLLHAMMRPQLSFSEYISRSSSPVSICMTDYLQWKEKSDKDFSQRYCGFESPPAISTIGNSIQIKFITGSQLTTTGFRLEWVMDGCGGHIQRQSGFISLNRNVLSGEELECEWLIETPVGTSVSIEITNLYMSQTENCSTDAVELYNGQNTNFPLLTRVCHSQVSSVQSTSNFMVVRFIKRSNLRGVYFRSSFATRQATCGGQIQALSGYIYSQNYPKNYDNNLDCTWVIEVPKLHRIQLNFMDIDLHSHRYDSQTNDCDDFIKVYNSARISIEKTNYSRIICPHELHVDPFISKDNEITVQFQSDSYGSAKGFKANFTVTCGAYITALTDGTISNQYIGGSNTSCIWTIVASKLYEKISLTITHLLLPMDTISNTTCPSTYLRVHDGDDADAPLINEYCGRKAPPMIVSQGNALTVVLGTYGERIVGRFSAHYSPVSEACGGTLSSEQGTIASPNYPRSYPVGSDCEWILSTSPGNRVALTFEQFGIEYSYGCNEDYLEIRENDGGGRLLGVYCGNEIPTNTTVASKLYIKFHSDEKNSGAGFVMHYEFLHGNDLLNMERGEIASPLYPNPYQGSGEYTWRVLSNGIEPLSITVDAVEIHSYTDVCINKLSIYDGYDETAPLLANLCSKLAGEPQIYQTSSNMAFIKFSMYDSDSQGLFHLSWQKYNKIDDFSEGEKINCGLNYTKVISPGNSTSLQSPNFPENYDNNMNCEWVFDATKGRHLQLTFREFEIEDTSRCFADHVSIFSAESLGQWKTVKDSLCETEEAISTNKFNTSRYMKITFKTDASVTRKGFRGQVNSLCGGLITDLSGEVGMLWEDVRSGVKIRCEWVIKVRSGRQIKFRFSHFNITNKDTDCRTSVTLRNGDSVEAPYLGNGVFCGYEHEDRNQMITASNALHIIYAANYNIFRNVFYNFKIHYEEQNVECGGTSELNEDENWEVISSLNYPSVPVPYSECIWIFTGPPGEIIRVDFIDRFDLDDTEDCRNEVVEIRDGSSEIAQSLGRYCGERPGSIKSSGNKLYIKYQTQLAEPRNGFKANVSINVCGGTIVSQSGQITSPGYPHILNLPSGSVCEWRIVGSPRFVFSVIMKDLDLPESETTCETKVTIQEKMPPNNTAVNILKEFCGDDDQDTVVTSSTNEVIIQYKIGNPSEWHSHHESRGFRLTFNSSKLSCGGLLRTSEGYFATPNYPIETSSRYCQWDIIVPDKTRRIKLEILDMDISKHVIGIYNNLQSLMQIIKTSNVNNTVFESSGNKMTILLWLNTAFTTHRFQARFSSTEAAVCGGDLQGVSGELNSPDIKQSFLCEWHYDSNMNNANDVVYNTILVTAKVNSSVSRNFCPFGDPRLNINTPDIDNGLSFSRNLCGVTEATYRIPSPVMNLKATKGLSNTITYNIKWRAQPCGGVIHLGENPVNILEIPKVTNDTIDCAWIISMPFDVRMELKTEGTFQHSCDDEFLSITHGTSQTATSLGDYCKDKTLDEPLNINYKTIYVQYHAKSINSLSIKLMGAIVNNECGGQLTNYQHIFKTPNYPKNYEPNQQCVWTITADLGSRVSLQFTERFVIESRPNCTKDVVIIYDWKDDNYKEIARVCGREIPPIYNSTYNKMKVVLRTDETINMDGFKANWTSICGGSYMATDKDQFIYSPGYPNDYSRFLDCTYTISAPQDKMLLVQFKEFELEGPSPECNYDNITITGDMSYTSFVGIYCGTKMPPVFTNYPSMTINFKSDDFLNRKGFKILYSIYQCGGHISEPTVLSSHIGDIYNDNMNCTWFIQAPVGKKVTFEFLFIDVEGQSECSNDYVAVFEGSVIELDQRLALMCGNVNSSTSLSSRGDKALLQFFTDSSYGSRGFKVQISFSYTEGVGCGGHIDLTASSSKTLKSFLLDGKTVYEPYLNCLWTVRSPPDTVVKIEFTAFHVSSCLNVNQTAIGISTCLCDFVEIKDGVNPDSLQIGKYCGHTLPPALMSSGNMMSVRISTDGDLASSGFQARLTVASSICGQTRFSLTDKATRIKTPGFDRGTVPRGLYCVYYFDVSQQSSSTVTLSVLNIDLHPATDINGRKKCINDKLLVTNHPIPQNNSFGKDYIVNHGADSFFYNYYSYESYGDFPSEIEMCGSSKPSDMYLSGTLTVTLYTSAESDSSNYRGVEFEVVSAGFCGRNYTGTQGKIQTLYHGQIQNSLESTDCFTLITAPENHTISAYFLSIMSDYWNDQIHLDIYDGATTFSTKMVTMGPEYSSTNPLFTTGRYMLLHSHEGGDGDHVNFDMNYITTDKGRGCGGNFTNEFGKVTSPLYPDIYRKKSVCEWRLETPIGTRLKLHFPTFDLGPTCDQNYVQLVDSHGEVVSTYCAEEPADYTSADNFVKIMFYTTMNNGGTGWVAEFVGLL